MEKSVKVTLNIELKDNEYIKSISEYVADVLTAQLEEDEYEFIEKWNLKIEEV